MHKIVIHTTLKVKTFIKCELNPYVRPLVQSTQQIILNVPPTHTVQMNKETWNYELFGKCQALQLC